MPLSAATGTKRAKAEPEAVEAADREPVAPTAECNGSIQVTAKDGSIVNVDAGQPDWKDRVRELDPKHPVLKYD